MITQLNYLSVCRIQFPEQIPVLGTLGCACAQGAELGRGLRSQHGIHTPPARGHPPLVSEDLHRPILLPCVGGHCTVELKAQQDAGVSRGHNVLRPGGGWAAQGSIPTASAPQALDSACPSGPEGSVSLFVKQKLSLGVHQAYKHSINR